MFILINCQVLQSPVSKWWTQTQVSHKGLIIKRMAKLVNLPWFNGHRLTSLYKKKNNKEIYPFDRVYTLSAREILGHSTLSGKGIFCNENYRVYEQEIMIFLK